MLGPCFVMYFLVAFKLCNHLDEEERASLLYFNCFLMSCGCLRSVALPHGAVGCSALCDCGIS